MKHYLAIEMAVIAGLTAALLSLSGSACLWVVVPIVVLAWVTLQLISSVAFCDAINKGQIVVFPGARGSKETYGVAKDAKPGWLVMRHVWTYRLIADPDRAARAAHR